MSLLSRGTVRPKFLKHPEYYSLPGRLSIPIVFDSTVTAAPLAAMVGRIFPSPVITIGYFSPVFRSNSGVSVSYALTSAFFGAQMVELLAKLGSAQHFFRGLRPD